MRKVTMQPERVFVSKRPDGSADVIFRDAKTEVKLELSLALWEQIGEFYGWFSKEEVTKPYDEDMH